MSSEFYFHVCVLDTRAYVHKEARECLRSVGVLELRHECWDLTLVLTAVQQVLSTTEGGGEFLMF